MNNLTSEQEEINSESLIFDGIQFVRALTITYGAEKGMEMWEKLGEVLGREVQGRIFFAMLTGISGDSIKVTSNASTMQGVEVIKCIRTYTGLGLKEAKDFWDESKYRQVAIKCDVRVRTEFSQELRRLGCKVV